MQCCNYNNLYEIRSRFGKSAAQKKAEMKAVAQGKGLSSSSASEQEKKDLTELVDEQTLRSVTEGVLVGKFEIYLYFLHIF